MGHFDPSPDFGHWTLDFLSSIVLLTEEDGPWASPVASPVRRRRGLRKKSSILWVISSSSRSVSSRLGSSRLSSAAVALAQASRCFLRLIISRVRRAKTLMSRAYLRGSSASFFL